jgi:hypothetical protein
MIKVEVLRKESKGTTMIVFESRDTSNEGLDKLDELYSALMGSRPKRGGYLGSHRFEIEVKDED